MGYYSEAFKELRPIPDSWEEPFHIQHEQMRIQYECWDWADENGIEFYPLMVTHYGSCYEDGSCGCKKKIQDELDYYREHGYKGPDYKWVFLPGQR